MKSASTSGQVHPLLLLNTAIRSIIHIFVYCVVVEKKKRKKNTQKVCVVFFCLSLFFGCLVARSSEKTFGIFFWEIAKWKRKICNDDVI